MFTHFIPVAFEAAWGVSRTRSAQSHSVIYA